jgi:hypothetical protein
MSTTTRRRHLIGRRNRYATRCCCCSTRLAPEAGELLDHQPGERWQAVCATCLAEILATERRQEEERRAAERRRAEEARARATPPRDPLIEMLEAMLRARQEQLRCERQIPPCLRALGLVPPVSVDEIKKAYRQLSFQHHPDRGGTDEKFIELNRHYEDALTLCQMGRVA